MLPTAPMNPVMSRSGCYLDLDAAVITRSPAIGRVEGTYSEPRDEVTRREYEIELPRCACWVSLPCTKRRHVFASDGQFCRPGGCLRAIGVLRTHERKSKHLHPRENRFVAAFPVDVPILAVAVQNIQVSGHDDLVSSLQRDERTEIRD